MSYGRIICNMVAISSFVFAGIFSNSTLYISGSMGTPYINGNAQLKDDYKYNIGIRKIALFPYQSRARYYKGTEKSLSDDAIMGALDGLEYLFLTSSVRNRNHEFIDQDYWIKWSSEKFITKFKYLNKESRDLQFVSYDARFKKMIGPAILSAGVNVMGHPVYGHPAYEDYEDPWWYLAYEYGFTDYLVPLHDLNGNEEIDSYYIWIETDPITEEGYWEMFYEEASYYWENSDSVAVAYSDAEFYEYHMPAIIDQYNKENKEKKWQAEASIVIGLDFYLGSDKYYSHIWVNTFPKTVGLTDKSYNGKEEQYDIGSLVGVNITNRIGVFLEGSKLKYYGREEYTVSTGINLKF